MTLPEDVFIDPDDALLIGLIRVTLGVPNKPYTPTYTPIDDDTTTTTEPETTTEDETTTENETEDETTTEPTIDDTTEDDTTESETDESSTEPTIAQTTGEGTTTESVTEPALDEPTTIESTAGTTEQTTAARTVVIPENLELYDEMPNGAVPLSNGWFAVELNDMGWWEIFDMSGVPLGVIFVPDGVDISDIDISFIEQNLIPFGNVTATTAVEVTELAKTPRDNPPTGDSDCFHVILGLFMLTLVGIVVVKKKAVR